MSNPLFSRYGNINNQQNNKNIISQLLSLRNNPGAILDILLQNGKINNQQYDELQPYKNSPEAIGRYLINSGKSAEISQAQQMANQVR